MVSSCDQIFGHCLPQFRFFGLDAAAVQQVQHFIERLLPRIEAVGRVVGVEQHADFVGEQPAQPVQKMPVGDILMAGVEKPLFFGVVRQIELHAVGVDAPADRLTELLPADVDLPGLHHLVGAEPVEMREGDFPHQLIEGFLRLEATGLDVGEVIENILACRLLLFGQVGHLGVRIGSDLILLGEDAVLPLKLLRNGVFEQLAALRHDVAELVANLLVHVTPPPAAALPPLAASVP